MTSPHYESRSFRPGIAPGQEDVQTAGWLDAVNLGFLVPSAASAHRKRMAQWLQDDHMVLEGVYATEGLAGDWAPQEPVATLASYVKSINVGAGRLLDACLIAYVTVRPTHRRRGHLRRLMEAGMSRAAQAGTPLAALTASEGTIYGRFGFGPATFTRAIEVDASRGFEIAAAQRGAVEIVDSSFVLEHGPTIFHAFHQTTTGSVDRQSSYPTQSVRAFGPDGTADDRIRVAAHFDDNGTADGYVSYRPSGWTGQPGHITVVDLVAATTEAYLELWRFLTAVDMVDAVRYDHARVDDPLVWAASNIDAVRTTRVKDSVWVRILDPVQALEARPYAGTGSAVLRIEDSMAFAAGTYRLDAAPSGANVTKLDDGHDADLRLDVAQLGSLYLGAVNAPTLAQAGRITELRPGAAQSVGRLFSTDRAPYGVTVF